VCSCLRDKPIEQEFAEPFGALVASCDEIVDVHEFSVREVFAISIAGDRSDFIVGLAVGQQVTIGLLAKDLGQHRWFVEVRPQLLQDREAASDFLFGAGESDGGSWHGGKGFGTIEVAESGGLESRLGVNGPQPKLLCSRRGVRMTARERAFDEGTGSRPIPC
jgi:hypothetical protein